MTSTVVANWKKNTGRPRYRFGNRKALHLLASVFGVVRPSKLRADGVMRSAVTRGVAVTEMYHGEAGSVLTVAGCDRFSLWQAS